MILANSTGVAVTDNYHDGARRDLNAFLSSVAHGTLRTSTPRKGSISLKPYHHFSYCNLGEPQYAALIIINGADKIAIALGATELLFDLVNGAEKAQPPSPPVRLIV